MEWPRYLANISHREILLSPHEERLQLSVLAGLWKTCVLLLLKSTFDSLQADCVISLFSTEMFWIHRLKKTNRQKTTPRWVHLFAVCQYSTQLNPFNGVFGSKLETRLVYLGRILKWWALSGVVLVNLDCRSLIIDFYPRHACPLRSSSCF